MDDQARKDKTRGKKWTKLDLSPGPTIRHFLAAAYLPHPHYTGNTTSIHHLNIQPSLDQRYVSTGESGVEQRRPGRKRLSMAGTRANNCLGVIITQVRD
ncbi:hypothetical protein E2C01_053954 [Portunus trituberculatus]|uniref:Uncharacterized protein n=1 Tax=Portunus trituberculatus TaxID=210409 RepID=A0A5B7GQN3_PORTR|nr:hypothetical protein [Portunus trituberculatus]